MGSIAVKRILAAGLFALCAAAGQAQNPSWGPTFWNGTSVPTLGQIPDYTTFHEAAKMLRTPCDVAGPASWQDLCAQMVLNLMALLPNVTPGASDTVMLIHGGVLSAATVAALAVGGGAGAPSDAEYVTGATNVTLSAERVGTSSTSITWDFATPGQAIVKRAALTGDVTASADGNATTIANNAVTTAKILDGNVTLAKMADMVTDRLIGRQSGTGVPELISASGGLEWTTNAIQTSAFTGDVTKAAGGTATTIAADAVVTGMIATGAVGNTDIADGAVTQAKIGAAAVSLDKIAHMATDSVLGRDTTGSGDPEVIPVDGVTLALNTDLHIADTAINSFTAKATPIGADSVAIVDSAASNVNKKATISSVLALNPTQVTANRSICESELFFNAAGNPHGTCFMIFTTSGTGAVSNLPAIAANEPGQTRCLVTAANDRCSLGGVTNAPQSMFFGGGVTRYTIKMSFTTTSDDATNDYTWRGGWSDSTSGGTNGVYLNANDDVNGSEFQLICVKATSGGTTTIDTNQAIPYGGGTPAFHTLEIEVNADATSAQFYYDGVAKGSPCTTNIPIVAADAVALSAGATIGGTGATSDSFTDYAYVKYVWNFTSAR